jgi:uncharacterized protein (TIGR02246 family)
MIRMMFVFCMLVGLALPARADDPALKQDVDKLVVAYMENYNKHDPAGLAKLFSKDHAYVSTQGVSTDMEKAFEGAFKTMPDAKLDAKAEKVWQVAPDVVSAQGTAKVTGKNTTTGAEVNNDNLWTAVYVKEDGVWKIKMLTAILKPPPAK